MKRRVALACALSALVLASCRTPAPPLESLSPDDPRPAAFRADWGARSAGRLALRGQARLAVDGKKRRHGERNLTLRARQRLVIARPARLRVEVAGLLGTTLVVLATDGKRYELLRPGDTYASGEVHDGLLWDVARLDLTPAQVVDVVLGTPRPDESLVMTAAYDAGEGRIRITLADDRGDVRRQMEFDREARLRWLQVRGDEEPWEARYDDYALVGDEPVAHTVSLDLQGGRTKAVLSLSQVELNPELPDEIFRLRPPAGGAPELARHEVSE